MSGWGGAPTLCQPPLGWDPEETDEEAGCVGKQAVGSEVRCLGDRPGSRLFCVILAVTLRAALSSLGGRGRWGKRPRLWGLNRTYRKVL